jgi:hypothetical protein
VFSGHLSCYGAVGHHQGLLALHPPGGNRYITLEQTTEHFCLLTPRHNPKHPPGAIENRYVNVMRRLPW